MTSKTMKIRKLIKKQTFKSIFELKTKSSTTLLIKIIIRNNTSNKNYYSS